MDNYQKEPNKKNFEVKMRTVTLQGITGFDKGLSVIVERRNLRINGTNKTWFQLGRSSYDKFIDVARVLPISAIDTLAAACYFRNDEMVVSTLLNIGDYIAGWLHEEEERANGKTTR